MLPRLGRDRQRAGDGRATGSPRTSRAHPDERLADVAYTLQRGRRRLAHRRFVVAGDPARRVAALDPARPGGPHGAAGPGREVVFMFPGQGASARAWRRELYAQEPVFRAEVDRAPLPARMLGSTCASCLYAGAGRDGRRGRRDGCTATAVAQPALFVVEYALARLW